VGSPWSLGGPTVDEFGRKVSENHGKMLGKSWETADFTDKCWENLEEMLRRW